jgi:hypothetical protein
VAATFAVAAKVLEFAAFAKAVAVTALMVAGPLVKVIAVVLITSWDRPMQTVSF